MPPQVGQPGILRVEVILKKVLPSFSPESMVVTMSNDQCYIHGHEPIPDGYFKICGECWHVFPTAQALIDDDLAVRREYLGPAMGPDPVEDIHICPHCTHDF